MTAYHSTYPIYQSHPTQSSYPSNTVQPTSAHNNYANYMQQTQQSISSLFAGAASALQEDIVSHVLNAVDLDKNRKENILMITICNLAEKVHCNGTLLNDIFVNNKEEKIHHDDVLNKKLSNIMHEIQSINYNFSEKFDILESSINKRLKSMDQHIEHNKNYDIDRLKQLNQRMIDLDKKLNGIHYKMTQFEAKNELKNEASNAQDLILLKLDANIGTLQKIGQSALKKTINAEKKNKLNWINIDKKLENMQQMIDSAAMSNAVALQSVRFKMDALSVIINGGIDSMDGGDYGEDKKENDAGIDAMDGGDYREDKKEVYGGSDDEKKGGDRGVNMEDFGGTGDVKKDGDIDLNICSHGGSGGGTKDGDTGLNTGKHGGSGGGKKVGDKLKSVGSTGGGIGGDLKCDNGLNMGDYGGQSGGNKDKDDEVKIGGDGGGGGSKKDGDNRLNIGNDGGSGGGKKDGLNIRDVGGTDDVKKGGYKVLDIGDIGGTDDVKKGNDIKRNTPDVGVKRGGLKDGDKRKIRNGRGSKRRKRKKKKINNGGTTTTPSNTPTTVNNKYDYYKKIVSFESSGNNLGTLLSGGKKEGNGKKIDLVPTTGTLLNVGKKDGNEGSIKPVPTTGKKDGNGEDIKFVSSTGTLLGFGKKDGNGGNIKPVPISGTLLSVDKKNGNGGIITYINDTNGINKYITSSGDGSQYIAPATSSTNDNLCDKTGGDRDKNDDLVSAKDDRIRTTSTSTISISHGAFSKLFKYKTITKDGHNVHKTSAPTNTNYINGNMVERGGDKTKKRFKFKDTMQSNIASSKDPFVGLGFSKDEYLKKLMQSQSV